MSGLKDRTLFITGGSRGIGLAIAKRAAQDGANVVLAAKTARPHPKLSGTIYTAAEEVEAAGGKALPLVVDVRDEECLKEAAAKAAEHFGGVDILINNASAIYLSGTLTTPMKRYDLMNQVNTRGSFATSQALLPYLQKSDNPHIMMMSPPLNMDPRWFRDHLAYTISKYGMSMCVLGLAEEFRSQGVAVNALWPKTVINTEALAMLGGLVPIEGCRQPAIVADAVHAVLCRDSKACSGNFFIDEEVLAEEGVTDFTNYAVKPGTKLFHDLFLND